MKISLESSCSFSKTLFQSTCKTDKSSETKKRDAADSRGFIKQAAAFDFSQLTKNISDARKAAIARRMAQLKEQLDALMKFSQGDVPPRLIAQLAKELKSLITQYGNAGGNTGAAATNMPTVSGNAAGNGASDNAAPGTDATEAASTAAQAETAASGQPSTAEIQSTVAAAMTASQQQADNSSKVTANAASSEQRTGTASVGKQGDAADRAFFSEAKKLLRTMKMLLKEHARKTANEKQEAEDIKDAKKALKETDEAIHKAETDMDSDASLAVNMTYDSGGETASESDADTSVSISTYA